MNAIAFFTKYFRRLVDILLDSFNTKVKNAIDGIAPLKVRTITGRRKAPWRKTAAVQSMKRTCIKLSICGKKHNLKFTITSIKTACMLSTLN